MDLGPSCLNLRVILRMFTLSYKSLGCLIEVLLSSSLIVVSVLETMCGDLFKKGEEGARWRKRMK